MNTTRVGKDPYRQRHVPVGFYPFTFEYLTQMQPEARQTYLATLEGLWKRYLSRHMQRQSLSTMNPEDRQELHWQFLQEIVSFYNTHLHLPSQYVDQPVFPLTETAETPCRAGDATSRNSHSCPKRNIDALLQVVEGIPEPMSHGELKPLVQGLRKRRIHQLDSVSPTRESEHEDEEVDEEEEDDEDEFEVDTNDMGVRGCRERSEMPFKKRKLPLTNEKRLSRYRSTPSKALLERLDSTRTGRFLLVEEMPPEDDSSAHNYRVWDRTGKVYDVHISNLPSCNCPASSKGLNCVHILFIFVKLLRVSEEDPILFQRALLSSELEQIYTSDATKIGEQCCFCFDQIPKEEERNCLSCSSIHHEECVRIVGGFDEECSANHTACDTCRKPEIVQ